ncbi:Transcriptional regulatory protein [Bradyrhizobium sp. STM 3843]|uniref:response regulator transcription factor n=1 Tax=Bradyrhizobium sp. STM 3843 TaxID=551947 RepID=UPI000240AAD2|nr:response regulator transcription factor [Bradyrhizobium sp. STM 3843]CCE05593.1 Transcriptional regulatory protein [Bradyrhizobium sp. STM 3843]
MRRRYVFETALVGKTSLLKEGIAEILRSANFRILTSVSCANELPASKAQPCQQLFLVVHTGGDFGSTIEQVELIRRQRPGGRIAIVSDRYRLDELASAFRAGVNGYFVDVMTSHIFIKSLELVMMGETVFPPAFLSFVLEPESDHAHEEAVRDDDHALLVTAEDGLAPRLSPREKSILHHLVEGESNKSIARKIDIAEATVKVHVKAILRKIRAHNRTQAAIWGLNNGWTKQTTNHLTTNNPWPDRADPISGRGIAEIKQATDQSHGA